MVDINNTINGAVANNMPGFLDSFVGPVQVVLAKLQWLVGGIFGLYLIFMLVKWYEIRSMKKSVAAIRDEVKTLNDSVLKLEKVVEDDIKFEHEILKKYKPKLNRK